MAPRDEMTTSNWRFGAVADCCIREVSGVVYNLLLLKYRITSQYFLLSIYNKLYFNFIRSN